jgi:SpoVK/Ycf46/Vps4 family AAA+-type ATPase
VSDHREPGGRRAARTRDDDRRVGSRSVAGRELIDSLLRAVANAPDDVELRLHVAELLVETGRAEAAIEHLAAALQVEPTSERARALMARAVGSPMTDADADAPAPPDDPGGPDEGFDWRRAEDDVRELAPPMFVTGDDEPPSTSTEDLEQPGVRLADVGGLAHVKARLEAAFLAPLRNPGLRRLFGKSLRGGLLLYGPPGCGKTFLARAIAGELGAQFLAVSLNDVLDMFVGQSERNLHDLFELARRSAPCVVFLDEVDAIGQKRAHLRHSAMRSTVNQLLHELDGVGADNQGVFVLAATNTPWDVDVALRRPGRLDRTVLVPPPDAPARETILRYHLRDRPISGIDTSKLAGRTDDFSGADLAHVCETAAERALMDSAQTGRVRMIGMRDLEAALDQVRPSTGPWFETARNVALFANDSGQYDDLVTYLKDRRLI